jgi:hypothetical protein
MAVAVGQRDEYVECVPGERKKIVWLRPFTAGSRHDWSLPVFVVANNGIITTGLG